MVVNYGLLSIIPTAVLIVLALKTRKLLESILVASIAGFIVIYKQDFFLNWVDALYTTFSGELFSFIAILMTCFGGFIKLLERSGGALAFGSYVKKYANTQKKSLFITYILGMIVFMDEYLNALAVTAATRSLNDQHKVPREMLALTVNTAGSPVCVLLPFSTWAAFYIGLIGSQGITTDNLSAADIYIQSIPYMFYPMIALIVTGLLIYGKIPRLGSLKKAYERVERTGNVLPEDADISDGGLEEDMESSDKDYKIRNFIVPMIAFVVAAIVSGNDIIVSSIIAITTCFVMYVGTKAMTVEEFTNTFIDGVKDFAYLMVMVLLLFVILEANTQLGFAEYVIGSLSPFMSAPILPFAVFVVMAALAFGIGSFWELSAIAMPIFIPLASQFGVAPTIITGAIISGAVFGNHSCFYSDAVILTSSGAQIKPFSGALAIIPYALISACISAVIYLGLGIIMY